MKILFPEAERVITSDNIEALKAEMKVLEDILRERAEIKTDPKK